ncbi:3-hydroxyacyl-CoA dehydrogenase NAD-binding domain-containing protein [Comamonas terrigena]|uniref:3-hydroxyacyl-CoA dehydrogenase NAD-binding domain-containing protein n=1 Tax=Comamonas terrigena TaxID=32013 RepID=UPI001D0E1359|nr:3-hydroxyacyl-CoA dehydrogenase NAD-binding domain-containing protein [Comamonas terrigena]
MPDSIARGQANVERSTTALIAKGRQTKRPRLTSWPRYTPFASSMRDATAGLVHEAVFEDLEGQEAVFQGVGSLCSPARLLATNTSYLASIAIARRHSVPKTVIGPALFSRPYIMKLLGDRVPAKVAPDVVTTACRAARGWRRSPVRAGVCDGFIGTALPGVTSQAGRSHQEAALSPTRFDEAVRGWLTPMGPFPGGRPAGGDIGWATRKRRAATRDPKARYVESGSRL